MTAAECFPHPALYLAAILLIAGRMMSLATKWTHEAMHFNLFRKKPWNDVIVWLVDQTGLNYISTQQPASPLTGTATA